MLSALVRGYETPDMHAVHPAEAECALQVQTSRTHVALVSGAMLRECIRHESLAKIVLHLPAFYSLFEHAEDSNFDVASDALRSLSVRSLGSRGYERTTSRSSTSVAP